MTYFLLILILMLGVTAIIPRNLLWATVVLMTLFAGLRGNVGYDTCDYREIFVQSLNGPTYGDVLFIYFVQLLRSFTDNSQIFLFTVAAMQGMFVYLIIRRLKRPREFLLIYILLFYYTFEFNILRNGLAILIVGYIYVNFLNNQKVSAVILAAPLVHITTVFSALLFFPLRKYLTLILVTAVLIYNSIDMNQIDVFARMAAKAINIFDGKYAQDTPTAWHVVLGILLVQVFLFEVFGRSINMVVFTLIITVFTVIDLYINMVGRVALTGYFCMAVYYSNRVEQVLSDRKKILGLAILCYFAASMTLYPILFGDQQAYHIDSRVSAGSYKFFEQVDLDRCN